MQGTGSCTEEPPASERISAWWMSRSMIAGGGHVVAEDLAPRAEGLLDVTIIDARS
jgi:hypothetical protein